MRHLAFNPRLLTWQCTNTAHKFRRLQSRIEYSMAIVIVQDRARLNISSHLRSNSRYKKGYKSRFQHSEHEDRSKRTTESEASHLDTRRSSPSLVRRSSGARRRTCLGARRAVRWLSAARLRQLLCARRDRNGEHGRLQVSSTQVED